MTNEDPRDTAPEPNPIDMLRAQIVAVAVIVAPAIYAVVAVLLKQFSMSPDGGFVLKSGELGPVVPVVGCVMAVAAAVRSGPARGIGL